MANSITQSAIEATGDSHKITEKGTMQAYQQQKDVATFLGESAKTGQERSEAISEYFSSGAEQSKQQGMNLMQSGTVKKAVGFGFVALGASFKAMSAIPFIGPMNAAAGIEMMAKGAGKIAEGVIDHSQGKKLIAAANEALEKATSHKVISKDHGKVARKEINRSTIFERKIEVLRQMLDELGIENEDMSADDLEKLKMEFMENFDKNFEDAASTLLNGGIMALDGIQDEDGKETGTQFFIKEGDDYFALDVPRDDLDNPLTGDRGEPLIKFDEGEGRHLGELVTDEKLIDLLDTKFKFVDALKSIAGELSTTGYDSNENAVSIPYDLGNREDLEEFVDLVFKTNINDIKQGRAPAPLLLTEENGEPGFQKVEYDLDPNSPTFGRTIPVGIFVSFFEMGGGEDPRGDGIESFTYAIERSQRSLAEVGLNQGGNIYGYVGPTTDRQQDFAQNTDSGDFGELSGRDSDAFAAFQSSISSTVELSQARSIFSSQRDILGGSQADAVGEGQA